jgi:hypothetical protein
MMIKPAVFLLAMLLLFSCSKDAKTSTPNNGTGTTTGTTPPPVLTSDTLTFSGYTWTMKNSSTGTLGPGPNNWSKANAYVDSNGYLHLKITKTNGKWYCAEVQSTQKFGYGKYQFWVDGRIDQLDNNVILGLFNYSGTDGIDEMDIEYGTFGGTRANSGFTVYPSAAVGGLQWHNGFNTTLTDTLTTQRFTRNSDKSVLFEEINGYYDDDSHIIDSISCTNPPNSISQVAMPVYMNLWLNKGDTPVNGLPAEIVIHSFKFTPQ